MKRKSFSLFFALTAFCVVFSCTSDDTAESDTSRRTDVPEGRTKTDTVYVRETVYEHDTVYVPDTIVVEDTEPRILEFQLLASQNSTVLIENVNCEIVGDSLIEGWIPHLTQDKLLIPHFKSVGKVSYNNSPVLSDTTTVDFADPVVLRVDDGAATKTYKVLIHAYTGLPVCWIETASRKDYISKTADVNAHMTIKKDVVTRSSYDLFDEDIKLRGRGNSTWDLPKKPYRFELSYKESILDMPAGKMWALLANYADKTMLRNRVANNFGYLSRLAYTPRTRFVEVWLNGMYNGTYLLSEKLTFSKDRINIGEDGYLLEIDAYAKNEGTSRCIYTKRLTQPINIKHPQVQYGDQKFNQAKQIVLEAESALYGSSFKDEEKGWRHYFDEEAMVDWYIINEISKNWDAVRWSSTFMTWVPGEKIVMGPIWDFDIAFGNANSGGDGCDSRPEGFHVKEQPWISRLFEDPYFVQLVKDRYQYFYSKKSAIMSEINADANYLRLAAQENDNKWQTLYIHTWRNRDVWGAYYNEVEYLKEWLDVRMDWLKKEFDDMR